MKKIVKILLIVVALLVCIFTSSCYSDDTKNDMELMDIKVYNFLGEEVFGEYQNRYGTTILNSKKLNSYLKELNSAAPVTNYLHIEAKEGDTFRVEFIFESRRNYQMKSLTLVNLYYDDFYDETTHLECSDIITIDNQIIARYTFMDINDEFNFFGVYEWYDQEDKKHRFNTKGSNTYIKGVVFELETDSIVESCY